MSDQKSNQLEILDREEPTALESIERASIDSQVATAKRYPRTLSKVKSDMLSFATLDEETAASCFYTLPRGGKTIQGPSVRLAEIALSCYSNLRAGSRPISTVTTGDHPHVIIQAVAHDLEKNVAITIEKRRRITKKKNKEAIDEDDINLAVNACSAIAFRDAVFKVVPLALIKPVFEQAKLVAIGDIKSLGVKRQKIVERLLQMGAKIENILGKVEAKKVEDIDLTKLELLIGLGTALKDGETTLEEAFPVPVVSEVAKSVFGATSTEKKAEPEKKAEEPAKPAEQAPAETPAQPPVEPPVSDPQQPGSKWVDKLQDLMLDNDVNEKALLAWAVSQKHISGSITNVTKLSETKAAIFVNNWAKIQEALKTTHNEQS